MKDSDVEAMNEPLQTTTLKYLGVSENSRVRQTLEFFSRFPKVIVIETSKMGNPYYVISKLAETYFQVMNADISKKRNKTLIQDRFIAGILFWCGLRCAELTYVRKKSY